MQTKEAIVTDRQKSPAAVSAATGAKENSTMPVIIPVMLLLAPPKIAGLLGPGDLFESQPLPLQASPNAPAHAVFEYGADAWGNLPGPVRAQIAPVMERLFDQMVRYLSGDCLSDTNLTTAFVNASKAVANTVSVPHRPASISRFRSDYQGEPPKLYGHGLPPTTRREPHPAITQADIDVMNLEAASAGYRVAETSFQRSMDDLQARRARFTKETAH